MSSMHRRGDVDEGDESCTSEYSFDDARGSHCESIEALRSQLEAERSDHENQVSALQTLMQRAQERTAFEMGALEKRIQEMETKGPIQQEKLRISKESLTNIDLSESVYLECRSIPENARSLRDFVTVEFYERFDSVRLQLTSALSENDRLKQLVNESQLENSQIQSISVRLQQRLNQSENDFVQETKLLQDRNTKLSQDVQSLSVRLESVKSKELLFDTIQVKLVKLEESKSKLTQEIAVLRLSEASAREERVSAVKLASDREQALELLRLDKIYLEREVFACRQIAEDARSDHEDLKNKIKKLKEHRETLYSTIEQCRRDSQLTYDAKLDEELRRLQSRSQSELDLIRIQQKEAYERELLGLREARDTSIIDRDRAMHKLEDLRSSYDVLRNELQLIKGTLEGQLQDSRSQLKIKSFEFDRISISYEEQISSHRRLQLSFDKLKTENELYKNQYYESRTESSKAQAELEASNASLNEKLRSYEQLECELDLAILQGSDEIENNVDLINVGSRIPSKSSRRIKQSLLLAQKLLAKQRELEVVKLELAKLKEHCNIIGAQLEQSKNQLSSVEQPYQFLIDSLKEREAELNQAKSSIDQLSRSLAESNKELHLVVSEKHAMECDLNLLLQRQADVEQTSEDYSDYTAVLPTKKTIDFDNNSEAVPRWFQKLSANRRPTE